MLVELQAPFPVVSNQPKRHIPDQSRASYQNPISAQSTRCQSNKIRSNSRQLRLLKKKHRRFFRLVAMQRCTLVLMKEFGDELEVERFDGGYGGGDDGKVELD